MSLFINNNLECKLILQLKDNGWLSVQKTLKAYPVVCYLKETHFTSKDTQANSLKMKE
jgi:hypothetical protein